MAIAVCGLVCGCDGPTAIHRWGTNRREWLDGFSRFRWRIETAFGQLAGRLHAKTTWARDLWHLSHRSNRQVLAHTACAWPNVTAGRPPLDFDGLLAG